MYFNNKSKMFLSWTSWQDFHRIDALYKMNESETENELLNIPDNARRLFPPCHFQVRDLLRFCIWVGGYWLNWFLPDLSCWLHWGKEFLMILCCQKCWNHRSPQTTLVHGLDYDQEWTQLTYSRLKQHRHLLTCWDLKRPLLLGD